MTLLMALVRSAYLAFLVVYTLVVSPLGVLWSGAATRQGATVAIPVVEKVYTATWLAIGWVALEAIASWVRVWLAARDRRRASAMATGPLPAA
jgi:hypothetical protein